jgi:hypothetical protein
VVTIFFPLKHLRLHFHISRQNGFHALRGSLTLRRFDDNSVTLRISQIRGVHIQGDEERFGDESPKNNKCPSIDILFRDSSMNFNYEVTGSRLTKKNQ